MKKSVKNTFSTPDSCESIPVIAKVPRPTWDHQTLLRALLTKVGRRNQGCGLEEKTSKDIALELVTIIWCGVLPAGAIGRLPSCILLTDLGPSAMCTYLCQSDWLYVRSGQNATNWPDEVQIKGFIPSKKFYLAEHCRPPPPLPPYLSSGKLFQKYKQCKQ